MRWFHRGLLAASATALVSGIAYAAGRGERLPAPDYVAALLADLPSAADKLAPHSPAREAIEAGDLDVAREMLAFRPLDEAPLPEGFPRFTPVGVIEVKRYPAYRKAVGPSFWTLFQHISKRSIPMTAPVEMRGDAAADVRGEMAFLYQNTSVGAPGPIDGIAVEDTPEMVVASLGVRGRMTGEKARAARAALEAWLRDQNEHRPVEGEAFRLFGYNSPMVPEGSAYWEAQIVLRLTDAP